MIKKKKKKKDDEDGVMKGKKFSRGGKKRCFRPGSNRGPCACEAHVITTTLRKQLTVVSLIYYIDPPHLFQNHSMLVEFLSCVRNLLDLGWNGESKYCKLPHFSQ